MTIYEKMDIFRSPTDITPKCDSVTVIVSELDSHEIQSFDAFGKGSENRQAK